MEREKLLKRNARSVDMLVNCEQVVSMLERVGVLEYSVRMMNFVALHVASLKTLKKVNVWKCIK